MDKMGFRFCHTSNQDHQFQYCLQDLAFELFAIEMHS